MPAATYGPHATWEPVIVVGGRKRRPGVRDWLRAQPARNGGDLPGRKPAAFCAWLFDLLGMVPGDHLVDLYPGTGIVGRAWQELSSRTSTTPTEMGQLPQAAGLCWPSHGLDLDVMRLTAAELEAVGQQRLHPMTNIRLVVA